MGNPNGSANIAAYQPFDLAWQPELGDYIEAFRARNQSRRAWLRISLCMAIMLAIAVVGAVEGDGTLIGLGVGGAIAIALVVLVLQPRAVRKLWRRSPALRARAGARVDPLSGVTTTNGPTTGQIQWSGIQSLLETERLFLVQLSGYRRAPFVVLAKRGLADPTQVDNLRALLNAGIASATPSA